MRFKPLGDHLVVEAMVQPDHTIMGIFLPEIAREKPQEGKVVAARMASASRWMSK